MGEPFSFLSLGCNNSKRWQITIQRASSSSSSSSLEGRIRWKNTFAPPSQAQAQALPWSPIWIQRCKSKKGNFLLDASLQQFVIDSFKNRCLTLNLNLSKDKVLFFLKNSKSSSSSRFRKTQNGDGVCLLCLRVVRQYTHAIEHFHNKKKKKKKKKTLAACWHQQQSFNI